MWEAVAAGDLRSGQGFLEPESRLLFEALPETTFPEQQQDVLIPARQRLLQHRGAVLKALLLQVDPAELDQGEVPRNAVDAVVRGDHFFEKLQGRPLFIQPPVGPTQPRADMPVVGELCAQLPQGVPRQVEAVLLKADLPQRREHAGVVRLDTDSFLQLLHRAFYIFEPEMGQSDKQPRHGRFAVLAPRSLRLQQGTLVITLLEKATGEKLVVDGGSAAVVFDDENTGQRKHERRGSQHLSTRSGGCRR